MKRIRFNQQGFTLAELILGMSLTVLLLSGIGTLLSVNIQSWLNGSSRTEVQQTARYAMDMMVRELRYAKNFTSESAYSNKYSVLFNDTSTPAPNKYRYYLQTTNHILYREPVSPDGTPQPVTGANVNGSTNVVINTNNETLFEVLDNNTVVITLTATDIVRNQSYTLRSVVYGVTKYIQ